MANQNTVRRNDTQRAVSPVIGVILMVAITVILAAVIGAFVLEIGDQQETAPNASFSTNERVTYMQTGSGATRSANITTVGVIHGGGDTLSISQTQLALNDNETVWAPKNINGDTMSQANVVPNQPSPNVCETVGDGDAEVKSGQQMHVMTSGGEQDRNIKKDSSKISSNWEISTQFPSDENFVEGNIDASVKASGYSWNPPNGVMDCTTKQFFYSLNTGGPHVKQQLNFDGTPRTVAAFQQVPMQGDDVQVIWEASSGGKTQTLFKYTVQTDSPLAE